MSGTGNRVLFYLVRAESIFKSFSPVKFSIFVRTSSYTTVVVFRKDIT